MLGCSPKPEERTLERFVEAQQAFDQADKLPVAEQKEAFRRVALMYQGLIDEGIQSGPLYYNLGNAWARSEEPGRALAAYHSARRFMPFDPHLASNMQTVLGDSVPSQATTPLIEHLFFWQDWIGIEQKATGTIVLAALTFLLGTAQLFIRHRRLRRLALISLTLTLLAVLSTGYDWYRFEQTAHAVVAVKEATPRKGNSESYELSFTSPVPLGTTATVLGERSGWLLLRFGSGQDGWLPKDQVVRF